MTAVVEPTPAEVAEASAADQPRGHLTTWKITFFVVAATSPMAAMVGTVPVGIAKGTGPGMPAAYLLAGLTMLCFMGGYAAMSRVVPGGGALYAYIRAGLGRVPGAAAAYVAALSYVAFTIGVVGAFAYFADLVLAIPGVGWQWYAAFLIGLMAILGRRRIDLSAWTLGILISLEVLVLVLMDLGILGHRGGDALPSTSFSPHVAFGAGIGAALTFAFTSFTGVESAALYANEARDPKRAVPRAGYWAVCLITVFYGLTSWLIVGGIGLDAVRARAEKDEGELVFNLATQYVGEGLTAAIALLLVTSFLSTGVAVHNAASRYLFNLGGEGLLPDSLGQVHPRFGSPARASMIVSGVTAVVVAAFAIGRMDPYMSLAISTISMATAGLMLLLLGASIAALCYFVRRPDERRLWSTTLAPGLATIGLAVAVTLVLAHYSDVTGTDSPIVNAIPLLIPVAFVAGVWRALWLRRRRPVQYAGLSLDGTVLLAAD